MLGLHGIGDSHDECELLARQFLNIHLCGAQDVGHEDEFFVGNACKDFLGASIQVIAIPPA
jgi:hypothetical protein